mmetsp:Transcript_22073/g.67923  ORF Transcript_22073/g.67923 Transcript_22073/m.67923 type:complete len:228 (-) Transcript_22073:802-1485(-)
MAGTRKGPDLVEGRENWRLELLGVVDGPDGEAAVELGEGCAAAEDVVEELFEVGDRAGGPSGAGAAAALDDDERRRGVVGEQTGEEGGGRRVGVELGEGEAVARVLGGDVGGVDVADDEGARPVRQAVALGLEVFRRRQHADLRGLRLFLGGAFLRGEDGLGFGQSLGHREGARLPRGRLRERLQFCHHRSLRRRWKSVRIGAERRGEHVFFVDESHVQRRRVERTV